MEDAESGKLLTGAGASHKKGGGRPRAPSAVPLTLTHPRPRANAGSRSTLVDGVRVVGVLSRVEVRELGEGHRVVWREKHAARAGAGGAKG